MKNPLSHKPKKSYENTIRVLCWSASAAASFLVAEAIVFLNMEKSQIEFHKDEDIFLECHTDWVDMLPEAIVTHSDLFNGRRLEVSHVSGHVNTAQKGDYTLTYSAKFGRKTAQTTRIVHVVDNTPPVITLQTKDGYFVTDFLDYEEEGVTVIDNHDGDISANVRAQHCGETILYTAQDSSGNETSIVRDIPYKDIEAPVITLSGQKHVYLQQGSEWVEPGYMVVDNYDTEVSNISIESSLDVNQIGDYTIKYIAKDAAGNESQIERLVSIIDKNADNVIYLTFDDGPSPYTMDLLDILDRYGNQIELGKPIGSDEKNNKTTFLSFMTKDEAYEEATKLTELAIKSIENIPNNIELCELGYYLLNRKK